MLRIFVQIFIFLIRIHNLGRWIGKLNVARKFKLGQHNNIDKRGVNTAQLAEKRNAWCFCCLEINQQVWPAFKLLSHAASPRCVS